MKIEKNTVATLTYQVSDEDGNMIDAGERPLVYLHGGYDGIFPMIEEALQGHTVGDKLEVLLKPMDAFGDYDEDLVQVEARSLFPDTLEVGLQFERSAEEGEDEMLFTVTGIDGDRVVLDGNHPLAGVPIRFICTVMDVRLATAEEVTTGALN